MGILHTHMQLQTLTKRLYKHKLALTALALLGAVLAMGATLLLELEYRTTSRYIIIQEQHFSDAFTQAKSAEYVSGILARVVDTDSFREAVFNKYDYVRGYFPESSEKLREQWSECVSVTPLKDTGILSIAVYNSDQESAEAIVFAVGDTLANNIKTYLGQGAAIEMRPIDGPITTDFPARPSFVNNAMAGIVLGLLFGILLFGFRQGRSKPGFTPNLVPATKVPLRAPAKPTGHIARGEAEFSRNEFEKWLRRAPAKA
ncbi:MAG: hypothetical protein V1895_02460 [Parcubacteria group bacterium]